MSTIYLLEKISKHTNEKNQNKQTELTGVVSWGPIFAKMLPSIFSLSCRTLEFSYVKYFGMGISISSLKVKKEKLWEF